MGPGAPLAHLLLLVCKVALDAKLQGCCCMSVDERQHIDVGQGGCIDECLALRDAKPGRDCDDCIWHGPP